MASFASFVSQLCLHTCVFVLSDSHGVVLPVVTKVSSKSVWNADGDPVWRRDNTSRSLWTGLESSVVSRHSAASVGRCCTEPRSGLVSTTPLSAHTHTHMTATCTWRPNHAQDWSVRLSTHTHTWLLHVREDPTTLRTGQYDAAHTHTHDCYMYVKTEPRVSEWVSSFLTAHQHIIGHSVP